ncbi:unnamed protein product, partial [Amoebophrya sp. A25]|eukprot:GSA25T00018875001.1
MVGSVHRGGGRNNVAVVKTHINSGSNTSSSNGLGRVNLNDAASSSSSSRWAASSSGSLHKNGSTSSTTTTTGNTSNSIKTSGKSRFSDIEEHQRTSSYKTTTASSSSTYDRFHRDDRQTSSGTTNQNHENYHEEGYEKTGYDRRGDPVIEKSDGPASWEKKHNYQHSPGKHNGGDRRDQGIRNRDARGGSSSRRTDRQQKPDNYDRVDDESNEPPHLSRTRSNGSHDVYLGQGLSSKAIQSTSKAMHSRQSNHIEQEQRPSTSASSTTASIYGGPREDRHHDARRRHRDRPSASSSGSCRTPPQELPRTRSRFDDVQTGPPSGQQSTSASQHCRGHSSCTTTNWQADHGPPNMSPPCGNSVPGRNYRDEGSCSANRSSRRDDVDHAHPSNANGLGRRIEQDLEEDYKNNVLHVYHSATSSRDVESGRRRPQRNYNYNQDQDVEDEQHQLDCGGHHGQASYYDTRDERR